MSDKAILVVDDEPNIVELVKLYLSREGFTVVPAHDGREALERFAEDRPALIVLDLMLPELDGWEVCRRIRRESDVPIIMLTARSEDIDKIVGLELGADDYLAKPFNPRELLARVRAVLRRSAPIATSVARPGGSIVVGNTSIYPERREVIVDGRRVDLTLKEFDLLVAFAQNPGIVLERDRLLNVVWGYDFFGGTRTVDVHVAHLRDRLEGSDLTIQTIRGVGYKAVIPSPAEPRRL